MTKLVNESLNEISAETFKSAIAQTHKYDQFNRGYKLGQTFFREFVGKPIMGGVIKEIGTIKTTGYFQVQITVYKKNETGQEKAETITYNVEDDYYDEENIRGLSRADARLLYLIARKINPDTMYKDINQKFDVKY